MDWADGTYTFRLPIGLLRELQEKTNAGPMQLLQRILDGTWRVDDLYHTLRLGLIGGGLTPNAALALATRYIADRPLQENVFPARFVLMAALFGTEDEPLGKVEPAESPDAPPSASASPASTGQAPS